MKLLISYVFWISLSLSLISLLIHGLFRVLLTRGLGFFFIDRHTDVTLLLSGETHGCDFAVDRHTGVALLLTGETHGCDFVTEWRDTWM